MGQSTRLKNSNGIHDHVHYLECTQENKYASTEKLCNIGSMVSCIVIKFLYFNNIRTANSQGFTIDSRERIHIRAMVLLRVSQILITTPGRKVKS